MYNAHFCLLRGLLWSWSYGGLIHNYLCTQCLLSPLTLWVWILLMVRRTRLTLCVFHWLMAGQWFSAGPPVSSANKTDGHNITEILLKVALNTKNPPICLLRDFWPGWAHSYYTQEFRKHIHIYNNKPLKVKRIGVYTHLQQSVL